MKRPFNSLKLNIFGEKHGGAQGLLVILLFLLPYCFLPLSLSYSRLAIPISLVALVLLSPTHLLPCSCSLLLSQRSFILYFHSSFSCAPTPALLLPLSYYSLTPLLLLASYSYSPAPLFYSFAVILILPTPSLLLLLDYSPCVYSCSPIAIIAFAFSCSYSLPPTLLFLSFKE